MIKFLFINPPSPFLLNQKCAPPLGILYLSTILRNAGYEVNFLELSNLNEDKWVIPGGYDFYGVTSTTPQYPYAKRILGKINSLGKTIIGGPHSSSLPQEVLQDGWYFVVVGEGENVIENLVKGYYFKGIVKGELIQDLDQIPFPARDLVSLQEYHPGIDRNIATTIITSRGCPYNCAYCCKKVSGLKPRWRSAQNVISEIDEIIEKYEIRNFVFVDDEFIFKRERLREICCALSKKDVNWRCNARTNNVSLEMFEMMKDGGCIEISFGIESGSQRVLDSINKNTKVEQNKEAIYLAKKAGITFKAYLIFGLPEDNRDSLEETKKFILQTRPDKVLLSTLIPVPGSRIWEHPEDFGITISKDYEKFVTAGLYRKGGVVVENKYMTSDEIEKCRDKLLEFLTGLGY